MKKFCKILVCFMLVVCTVFTFAACNSVNWTKTTNDTSKVTNNGGILTVRGGYMYFINGTKENNGKGNKGNIIQSAIYKVAIDDKGDIADDAKYEKVVNALVGFDNGSVFAFGDYIYYTTPCNDLNKSGEVLYNKTEFRRYDLINKSSQLIYTTNTSEEDFEFSYYKQGDGLYLLIYEAGGSKTLKSIKIDTKMKTIFTKEKVQSVLFAENGGSESGANSYAYYTLSADINSAYPSGVRVYKVLPNGADKQMISEGKTVSLLAVRGNKLIYSFDSSCYYADITKGKNTLEFNTSNIVCYNTYDVIVFNEDLSVLVMDGTTLRKIKYVNGIKDETASKQIYLFNDKTKVEFVGISGKYLVYTISQVVYKIDIVSESAVPAKVSTTSLDKNKDGSILLPEIVGDYLYAFCTDKDSKVSYMYKFDLTEQAKEAEAKRIGVIE